MVDCMEASEGDRDTVRETAPPLSTMEDPPLALAFPSDDDEGNNGGGGPGCGSGTARSPG